MIGSLAKERKVHSSIFVDNGCVPCHALVDETLRRMATEDREPTLDVAALDLPSDAIPFKAVRERHAELFSLDQAYLTARTSELDVVAIFHHELMLARKAFAKEAGLADPHPDFSRRDLLTILDEAYQEYGLSGGLEQSRLLVRDIEQAARGQYRSPNGPAR